MRSHCPACESDVSPGDRYCGICGRQLHPSRGIWIAVAGLAGLVSLAVVAVIVLGVVVGDETATKAPTPTVVAEPTRVPGEFRAEHPLPSEATLRDASLLLDTPASGCQGEGRRICMVAVGEPAPGLMVDELAAYLSATYDLEIGILEPLRLAGRQQFDGHFVDREREQLDAFHVQGLLNEVYQDNTLSRDVTIIAVTSHDMFDSVTPNLRYRTASRILAVGRLSVISTARLDEAAYGYPRNDELLLDRLRKAASRELGIMHYGLALTDDPRSIMRRSINSPLAYDEMRDLLDLSGLMSDLEFVPRPTP